MPIVAVLDANVLYPAPIRDLLLHMAFLSIYQPKWSDKIQEEWTCSLLAKRSDLKKSSLKNTCKWMDTVFPDARTLKDKELKTPINLPDKNDIHIVETAINSHANYIITFNLKDFPKDELEKYDVETIHPDDFVCQMLDELPDVILKAFHNQVLLLKKPAKTADEVLTAIQRCGLPKTENKLRRLVQASSVT
jgi:predicted nucleic acid-binding protein